MSEAPRLVQHEYTSAFGLYYPDDGRIETYIGNDLKEVCSATDGDVGEYWHEAELGDLTASIEADIAEAREEIDELRGADLSDEQAEKLDRLESRLESQEAALELNKEATNDDE